MRLKAPKGRVILKVDMQVKNSHKFQDGTVIRLERQYNNLNQRETQPVNAIVEDSPDLEKGVEVLCHHTCFHDTYRIFNYNQLSGGDIASEIRYFSVPEEMIFLYRKGDAWLPVKGFETGLRVFKPYEGILQGIEPKLVKDKLFITSGNLKGKVCLTLKSCDYQIVFQDINGREGNIIRLRHSDDEFHPREEIVAVDNEATELVQKGELLIGLTPTDAKELHANERAVYY